MKTYVISNPEYNNEHERGFTLQELQALYPMLELRESNTNFAGNYAECIRDQDDAEIAIEESAYLGS